ncbi:hypothetical protein HQ560_00260 [bacterium]|nr:hypothetical protein [bacterium]
MPALSAYNAGMKTTQRIQYTLRGIPQELDEALRRRAKEERISLNKAVIQTLDEGLRASGEEILHHDLDDLIGTWVDDPEFDKIIAEMDVIDPEIWE